MAFFKKRNVVFLAFLTFISEVVEAKVEACGTDGFQFAAMWFFFMKNGWK